MKKIRAGIIGGAGYTGGELVRVLLYHPGVEIVLVQSSSNAGKHLYKVHKDLLGETPLVFSGAYQRYTDIDVLFLCGNHGSAKKFIVENPLHNNLVVIDLSQDFRHNETHETGGRTFQYGLPELYRENIRNAKNIANPGCFATCIQLALLPLAAAQKIQGEVYINATTGSTGAGQSMSATSHFSWRDSNLSVYKAFTHQHLKEITESLSQLQPIAETDIAFVPQRGNFTRGIFSAIHLKCEDDLDSLYRLYTHYYSSHPFVAISNTAIDLKQVVNTNRCFIHLEKNDGRLLITSAIDNLLKGASGQAVQNMNLIFGLPEQAGLQLKPSAF